MLIGDLIIWFYENMAGIQSDIEDPGFRHIIMNPILINDLSYAKASYRSIYGTIVSDWKIDGDKYIWNISVPVNTKATISIPAMQESDVTEGNNPASKSYGVEFIKMENGRAVFEIGSGSYTFVSSDFAKPASHKAFVLAPSISPNDTIAKTPASVTVSMKCPTEGAEIRYTLDGSEPTKDSKLYKEPFSVSGYCMVIARAYKEGAIESQVVSSQIDIYDPLTNGMNYKYYEGKWTNIPDFTKLTPLHTGEVASFNVSKLKKREDYFGMTFDGFITIPADGEYYFAINSDDGSRLVIDNRFSILNDGIHGIAEKHDVFKIAKGKYPIRLEFFDGNYNEVLYVNIKGPGLPLQRLPMAMLTKK